MRIKETLLNLSDKQKKELTRSARDLLYFLGECEYKSQAFLDHNLLGQNWLTLDNLDYVPSQVIDNKVKPLLNKQARFMLSKKPDVLFKGYDKNDKELVEDLRQFVDSILSANKFWSNTMKAFKLATITKRVMLRVEANPGQPIRIYWHGINDFAYEFDPSDASKLTKVKLVKPDPITASYEEEKQIWYRYTYYLEVDKKKESHCYLITESFMGCNLETPIESRAMDTGLSKIPCWVIYNEKDMANLYGQSDLTDLKPLQNQYNRKLSDFSDALRFQMFGQDVFIDATEDSVNSSKIAPNAVLALASLEGRKADYKKVENTFSNVEPVKFFLQLLDDSMHDKLAIPKPEEIKKVLSGKAFKYLYTELVARCDEKWIDWEPPIRQIIRFIIEACGLFNCYEKWNPAWNELLYNIVLKKNYPIPQDEEDAKRLGMEEVATNVRSHRSYIKEFSNDEEYEDQFKEICEDVASITAAENEQYNTS